MDEQPPSPSSPPSIQNNVDWESLVEAEVEEVFNTFRDAFNHLNDTILHEIEVSNNLSERLRILREKYEKNRCENPACRRNNRTDLICSYYNKCIICEMKKPQQGARTGSQTQTIQFQLKMPDPSVNDMLTVLQRNDVNVPPTAMESQIRSLYHQWIEGLPTEMPLEEYNKMFDDLAKSLSVITEDANKTDELPK